MITLSMVLLFWMLQAVVCSVSNSTLPDIYFIRPTDFPPSSCPNQPCLTLHQYSQANNFTTGTTLLFLPGNHSLSQTTLKLTRVSNVTLKGETAANIVCTNEVTIQCKYVKHLKIEGLKFLLNHAGSTSQLFGILSALELINSAEVVISNSTFQGSGNLEMVASAVSLKHTKSTIKGCEFNGIVGGAIHALQNTELIICGCSFTSNKGTGDGGVIYATSNSVILLDGSMPNVFNHNMEQFGGGAIQCNECTLEMGGDNTFWNNSAGGGGALYVIDGQLTFSGNTYLSHNMVIRLGGAVYVQDSTMVFNGTTLVLRGNLAGENGGGMHIQNTSVITLTRSLKFVGNTAHSAGGALNIDSRTMGKVAEKIFLSGEFIDNTCMHMVCGGAVRAWSAQITFTDTHMISNSNAALDVTKSNITFRGSTRIVTNTDGGIRAESSSITFEDDTIFDSNSGIDGGALNCQQGMVHLCGRILFIRNKADRNGGAFYAAGTSVYIQDHANFTFNSADENGGAMYLESVTTLTLTEFTGYTQLSTLGNSAHKYGGGIYYVDIPTTHQCSQEYSTEGFLKLPYCFLQVEPFESVEIGLIIINSCNDVAGIDGNFLYGGLLDRCRLNSDIESWDAGVDLFSVYEALSITSLANQRKDVTSKPYELCVCNNNETSLRYLGTCAKTLNIEVHRGQTFTVSLLAISQTGTTSTSVTAITSSTAKLETYQTFQLIPNFCHPLHYTLYSAASQEEVVLYPDGPCRDNGLAKVVINATLLPCPDGFSLDAEICTCTDRIQRPDVNCTIADGPFITKAAGSKFWMGALYTNATYQGLILGMLCPSEYCKTGAVHISLDNPDVQCDHHRSGLLCGACATNHSLMLGSSRCQVCSNTYLALLLLFAAAGIALVTFLTFLRLTIATGSLNCIILYANIVQVNRKLFLPINTRNVLTVFIAWMNLDLGFETCFCDGLDAYAQTWLQFAFPFYVWLLIGLVILVSRHSIMMSKLIGHNPVAVLATLLLLSYTKILKVITEVYSSANLDYPGNKTVTVWMKDANVPYLQSKHLFLTVVTSLVLVFFFLPYTLFLLLGHKLYRLSGRKHFHWLVKIKPLLDSYHAPYKIRSRHWTGVLLLIRCTLYIIFLLDPISMNKSCVAIILTFTVLGFTMGTVYAGRIYKGGLNNLLEAGTYLNLIVLSTTALAGFLSKALVYLLVGISFTFTLLISAYQFHLLYIAKTSLWQRLEEKWFQIKSKCRATKKISGCLLPQATNMSHDPHKIITKTVIELREPLIED